MASILSLVFANDYSFFLAMEAVDNSPASYRGGIQFSFPAPTKGAQSPRRGDLLANDGMTALALDFNVSSLSSLFSYC